MGEIFGWHRELEQEPDAKARELLAMSKGELTYFRYLYELFWGGYKRTKLLLPEKRLVRQMVDEKPFEPFGVPNQVSTFESDNK